MERIFTLEKFSTDFPINLSEQQKNEIQSRIEAIQKKIKAAEEKSPYRQKVSLLLATKTRTPDEIKRDEEELDYFIAELNQFFKERKKNNNE